MRAGVFHEAVDEIDGGVGLARAGGHLDERARTTGGEGFFQAGDGLDLRGPERAGGQRWKFAEALGELLFLLHPGEQGFGTMKREHAAAARVGIEAVGEEGFRARALVAERERRFPRRQAERDAGDILGGLLLDAGEGVAFGLGLDRADGFGVNEQRVVRFAGLEGEFADGDTARGREVDLVLRLDGPARRGEHRVNLPAGALFGAVRHRGAL